MPEERYETHSGLHDLSEADYSRLSNMSVFFGHQSVGYNILEGVTDIMGEYDAVDLCIVETTDPDEMGPGVLAHAGVGRNQDPLSKIGAFSQYVHEAAAKGLDVALVKFCYVDFGPDTDIDGVFAAYKDTMAELQRQYPATTIVHVSVPLVARDTGIKTVAKRILGRPRRGYEDNLARERFNKLLREEYSGEVPLFDLASLESTSLDGKRRVYSIHDETYYALLPEYTDDGGHLNERGRRIVAEQLLVFLARLGE